MAGEKKNEPNILNICCAKDTTSREEKDIQRHLHTTMFVYFIHQKQNTTQTCLFISPLKIESHGAKECRESSCPCEKLGSASLCARFSSLSGLKPSPSWPNSLSVSLRFLEVPGGHRCHHGRPTPSWHPGGHRRHHGWIPCVVEPRRGTVAIMAGLHHHGVQGVSVALMAGYLFRRHHGRLPIPREHHVEPEFGFVPVLSDGTASRLVSLRHLGELAPRVGVLRGASSSARRLLGSRTATRRRASPVR